MGKKRSPAAGDGRAMVLEAGRRSEADNSPTPPSRQGAQEASDSYRRVIAKLSKDWRVILCPAKIQWIAQRRDPGGTRWRSISFFTQSLWLRQFCEPLCDDVVAWRVLERLPEHVSGRQGTRPEPRKGNSGSRVAAKADAAVAGGGAR